jgi:KDO2-lipid IV(A) lauroyltransferase
MLNYFLYKLGEFFACIFPWRIAYGFSIILANLQFAISKKDREAVINNLRIILPNEDEKVLFHKAKEVFINFGLYLVEFFRFSKIDRDYVNKHFYVSGKKNIDKALEKGRGIVLLAAHMGNWELAGMALSLLGYPLMVIALDHKNPKVNDFFKKRRQSKGIEVVSLGTSIKQCYRGLRENKIVALLGDREFGDSGYPLEFLGKIKIIPRGAAVLALRTGASLVPVFVTRQGLNCLKMECLPELEIKQGESELGVIKRYTKIIEGQIRKNPSQWLMFREFWKE